MAIQKIPNTLIADNAVTAAKIANGSLTADDISNNSITAAKISVSTSPTFADLTLSGSLNNMTISASGFTCPTSQNFVINSPNGFRVNIDSNNDGTQENFVVGNNQTDAAANNILFKVNEAGKASIGHGAANANLHIGSSAATGNATNPALQIGGTSTYRMGLYTSAEGAVIENKNGDDGIQFRVKTTGESMRLDTTGNLLLGTTSGTSIQLHVDGSRANGLAAQFTNSQSSTGSGIVVKGGNNSSTYSADFRDYNNNNLMRIRGDGNVGIGTSNPQMGLHVGSGTQSTAALAGIGIANGGSSYSFYSASDGTKQYIAGIDHNITYTKAGSLSNHSHAIVSNNTVRLFCKNDGFLGIGDIDPDSTVHIKNSTAGGPQIHMDDGTNSAFINFDGQSVQISTQRDMVDGTWHNTSRSWGGINIVGHSTGSYITFQTAPSNNTSPSERLRIQANGGISFNGDTAAANALDDYEEGTWTPACGATLSTAVGKYTKIGNQVTVYYHLVTTGGLPTSTSQVIITGLPFTSNSGSLVAAPIYSRYYTPNDSSLTSLVQDSETQIRLMNINDQNFDYTIWGELEASGNNSVYIIGSATYMV